MTESTSLNVLNTAPADPLATVAPNNRQPNKAAADPQFQLLYNELRRAARHALWQHGGGMAISATTVLHQAYLNMAQSGQSLVFPDKARFLGYASCVMRTFIIDAVRSQQAQKRGGQFEFTQLDTHALHSAKAPHNAEQLQALSDALDELAHTEPALAELVDQKYFFGRTFADIALERHVSERTVQRDWAIARALLRNSLAPDDEPPHVAA